jgi:hypothetical protein
VLHDTLKQLVEDVWRDGNVYVHQWKRLPKGVNDWLDSAIFTGGMKVTRFAIGQSVRVQCLSVVVGQECVVFPKSIIRDPTLGAFAIVGASH